MVRSQMNGDLEGTSEGSVRSLSEVPYRNLSEGTEKNHEKSQLGQPEFRSGMEPSTSWM
jgi:hypothetical protein